MKQEHYPSLELCKNLTEAGFPRTEQTITNEYMGIFDCFCPSVMELLDEIPQTIMVEGKNYTFNMDCSHGCWYFIWDDDLNYILLKEFDGGIPNALAEMILWLHENKYLTF